MLGVPAGEYAARKEPKSDVSIILDGSQVPSLPTVRGWCSLFSRFLQYLEADEVGGDSSEGFFCTQLAAGHSGSSLPSSWAHTPCTEGLVWCH